MTNIKTITQSELARRAFCNSKDLPQVINNGGTRFEWVGIGWIEAGPAQGDEVVVETPTTINPKGE